MAPTGRSTPRLMPPKKEGIATRVNRFGFRQPQGNRLHKVTDLNNPPLEFANNNVTKKTLQARVDSNKNKMTKTGNLPQVSILSEFIVLYINFYNLRFFKKPILTLILVL